MDNKVFVTRMIDKKGIGMLDKFKLSLNKEDKILSKEELIEKAKGSEALLTLLTDKIDGDVMDAIGPQLKIIANYAVGFDNINIEEATKRKIVVTNTPEVMTQAVAEHAMALILACCRRIVEGDEFVRAKKYKQWEPNLLLGPEIAGKNLGIIGIGRIGAALAYIAYHGFGMKVLYYDLAKNEELERNLQADKVSLDNLLERSDFVSLHVPLLPSTKHLISDRELKLMKKTAVLVNTARGPVIDEKALAKALWNKDIFAAGIDVFEFEPNPIKELLALPNVILTPHIASATVEARKSMAECAAENIIEVLHNRPAKTPVNKIETETIK